MTTTDPPQKLDVFLDELNFSLMHHPMQMNAMESLKDVNMIKMDLLSGFLAEVLINYIFTDYKFNPLNMGLILASRSIVDTLYYYLISKTNAFGGSLLELSLSILIYPLLFKMLNMGRNQMLFMHGLLNVIVLFAVARVTNWG